MIYYFPGLFCRDDMWKPYSALGESKVFDIDTDLLSISEDDIFIGYSMGGRIALRIAHELKFKIKKLILLSAHPGLENSEKSLRRQWEQNIIHQMRTLSSLEFFDFWDSIPIFSDSKVNREMTPEEFASHQIKFEKNLLSNQTNYLSSLVLHKEKVIYIYGKRDQKYKKIGEHLRSQSIPCIEVDSDHRTYLNDSYLIPLLQREINL